MIEMLVLMFTALMLLGSALLWIMAAKNQPLHRERRRPVLQGSPRDLEHQHERYGKITAEGFEPVWNPLFGWMPGRHFMEDEFPPTELDVLMREFDTLICSRTFTPEIVQRAQDLVRKIDTLKAGS